MIWPEKLYQFTKVQGAIKIWKFSAVDKGDSLYAFYRNNYGQVRQVYYLNVKGYHTSLESCYEAWIESIEKFKQKVIKQFENKCGVDYYEISIKKIKSQIQQVKDELV